jgi:hypothetical protein
VLEAVTGRDSKVRYPILELIRAHGWGGVSDIVPSIQAEYRWGSRSGFDARSPRLGSYICRCGKSGPAMLL